MDFLNRVVIVTGASAGIGADTAILFAQHSAKLVVVGRNVAALEEIARKCQESRGIKPLVIKTELTRDEDVKNIITETIKVFGRIDVLINNAGMAITADITDGIEHFDKVMSINIRAPYLLTGLAIPYLLKSKGNIVNVSSIGGMKPIGDVKFLAYDMSKAAMDNFTKHLALQLGPQGVRVNSVNPGITKTGFVKTAGFENPEEIFKSRESTLPLRKMCQSEEVADLILYVASDRARSITGSCIVIDNGEILL
ncbi:uncharacterized oxidoreductase TM_0325-like [Aricia agestis]|uniref:uncharacterized oxidoreductase TM_0325-like n=1 Tax=Aricia agestis TaxID=91739 RepID=UPI001C203B99|nr:uncharacterized oxidoreductase TM_0325-like [Aricia agestis]